MSVAPVLELAGVSRSFGVVRAVHGVDLRIGTGESCALVGRSGSGKTTIARLIVGAETPDAGVVRLLGLDIAAVRGAPRRAVLTRVGMIAQDAYAALSPSARVIDIVAEPLRIAGVATTEARARAAVALDEVGLGQPGLHRRTTDELSGGERQRVGLARAIAPGPVLLIADEATSMLDAPRQRELLDLLAAVRTSVPFALLLITHDLALAALACQRIVVMDAGRVVEDGPAHRVLARPLAAATRALVEATRVRMEAIEAIREPAPVADHDLRSIAACDTFVTFGHGQHEPGGSE